MTEETLYTDYAPAERLPMEQIIKQHIVWTESPQLSLIVEAIPQGTVIVNGCRQIVFVNQRFAQMTGGKESRDLLGMRVGETLGCAYSHQAPGGCGTTRFCRDCGAVNAVLSSLTGIKSVEECTIHRGTNDPLLNLRVWATPVEIAEEQFVIFVVQDIRLEKENLELLHQVQQLALTDSLTGMTNRRHFFTLAEHEFSRAVRYPSPFCIVLIDLDHFKSVNDTFGHLVGDEVLVEAAKRMQQETRSTDIPARLGGDEFVILLPETTLPEALNMVARIQANFESSSFVTSKGDLHITTSAGAAEYDPGQTNSLEALLEKADQSLYVQKRILHAARL